MPNLRRIRSSSPRPGCEPPSPAFDSSIILPAFNFDDFESRDNDQPGSPSSLSNTAGPDEADNPAIDQTRSSLTSTTVLVPDSQLSTSRGSLSVFEPNVENEVIPSSPMDISQQDGRHGQKSLLVSYLGVFSAILVDKDTSNEQFLTLMKEALEISRCSLVISAQGFSCLDSDIPGLGFIKNKTPQNGTINIVPKPRKRAPRKEELLMCLWQSEGREPSETELEDSPVIKRNHNQNKELFQKHFGSDFGVKVTWMKCPICRKKYKASSNGGCRNLVVHLAAKIQKDVLDTQSRNSVEAFLTEVKTMKAP